MRERDTQGYEPSHDLNLLEALKFWPRFWKLSTSSISPNAPCCLMFHVVWLPFNTSCWSIMFRIFAIKLNSSSILLIIWSDKSLVKEALHKILQTTSQQVHLTVTRTQRPSQVPWILPFHLLTVQTTILLSLIKNFFIGITGVVTRVPRIYNFWWRLEFWHTVRAHDTCRHMQANLPPLLVVLPVSLGNSINALPLVALWSKSRMVRVCTSWGSLTWSKDISQSLCLFCKMETLWSQRKDQGWGSVQWMCHLCESYLWFGSFVIPGASEHIWNSQE